MDGVAVRLIRMSSDNNHVVLKELVAAQEAGEIVVLATVVKARGSVPRHVGTKMVVYENGFTFTTIC